MTLWKILLLIVKCMPCLFIFRAHCPRYLPSGSSLWMPGSCQPKAGCWGACHQPERNDRFSPCIPQPWQAGEKKKDTGPECRVISPRHGIWHVQLGRDCWDLRIDLHTGPLHRLSHLNKRGEYFCRAAHDYQKSQYVCMKNRFGVVNHRGHS